jgi:hypothetical protein
MDPIRELVYNTSRINTLNNDEWRQELENSVKSRGFQSIIRFEEYIKQHLSFYTKKSLIFDIHQLREHINHICIEAGLNKRNVILQINNHFQYKLDDYKISQYKYLKHYCKLNLEAITQKQIDCLDKDIDKYGHFLSPENIENIILRYHYARSKYSNPSYDQIFKLDLPSTRKLSAHDFNDLIIKDIPITELETIIKNQYNYISYNELYDEYIHRVERQDKFYFITIRPGMRPIKESQRLLDDKNFNLYDELQSKKIAVNVSDFTLKIDSYCNTIKEELKLIELIINFDLLIDEENWIQAKQLILSSSLSNHQHCLLLQILNGTLDLSIQRYTNDYRTFINEIIDELSLNPNNCDSYISNSIPVCLHKTFHYYTLHRWVLSFNKILKTKGILISGFLTPDQRLTINTKLTDPKSGYCDKCYNEYDNLKNQIINIGNIPNNPPLELYYILIKYKNKMPLYRLKFSDQCDIQSELKPKTNHLTEYMNTLEGTINIQTQMLTAIMKDPFMDLM